MSNLKERPRRRHRVSTLDRTEFKFLPIAADAAPYGLKFTDIAVGGYGVGVAHRFAHVSRTAIDQMRRKAKEAN